MTSALVGIRLQAFHWRMREARTAAGLTQAQLGQLTGMQVAAIGAIETFRQRPSPEQQDEIADALAVPRSDLFPPEVLSLYGPVPSSVTFAVPASRLPRLTAASDPVAGLLQAGDAHASLMEALTTLPARQRTVIMERFGLVDGQSKTLEDTGRAVGATRERVRQIEASGLQKLRHPMRSKGIRDLWLDPDNEQIAGDGGRGHLVTREELCGFFADIRGLEQQGDAQASVVWSRYVRPVPISPEAIAARWGEPVEGVRALERAGLWNIGRSWRFRRGHSGIVFPPALAGVLERTPTPPEAWKGQGVALVVTDGTIYDAVWR